jgi:threonine dehydratase
VLVTEHELLAAMGTMIEKTRTLVEPAGAAPLAAALSAAVNPKLAGRKVALICTGANISPAQLRLVVGG